MLQSFVKSITISPVFLCWSYHWICSLSTTSDQFPSLFELFSKLFWNLFPTLHSVQFSHSVVSNSLGPHELRHIRPTCPSPTPKFTQTHVHRVHDAIQPSHPLSSPSPPAPNPSQHQSLFQWVSSSHEVAMGKEFEKRIDTRVCITDSLCCTTETSTTL